LALHAIDLMATADFLGLLFLGGLSYLAGKCGVPQIWAQFSTDTTAVLSVENSAKSGRWFSRLIWPACKEFAIKRSQIVGLWFSVAGENGNPQRFQGKTPPVEKLCIPVGSRAHFRRDFSCSSTRV
jgi:hypothetical protein